MNEQAAPIRILIVDDMPQVRYDLRTVLPLAGEQAGLQIQVVGEAGDGQEAARQAALLQPDVVLMDLGMPVLDGYAATQMIKAQRPSTAVIALTVHNTPACQARAEQAGVDGFIVKGAPVGEIILAIGRVRPQLHF